MATFSEAFSRAEVKPDFAPGIDCAVLGLEEPDLPENPNEFCRAKGVHEMDPLASDADAIAAAGPGSSESESTQTTRSLMDQVRYLQQQVAACLASQPLLYQVLERCSTLEQKMEAMKEEVDRALKLNVVPKESVPTLQRNISGVPPTPIPTLAGNLGFSIRLAPAPTSTSRLDQVKIRKSFESRAHRSGLLQQAEDSDEGYPSPDAPPPAYRCKFCPLSEQLGFPDAEGLADHYTSSHPLPTLDSKMFTERAPSSPEGRTGIPTRIATSSQKAASGTTTSSTPKPLQRHRHPRSRRYTRFPSASLCPECGKLQANQATLTRHMRIHTGERPFSCPYCFKRFKDHGHLRSHVFLHTGKPFKCDQCDRGFRGRYELASHQKRQCSSGGPG